LQAMFFDSQDEFPEVRRFVQWVAQALGLKMMVVAAGKSFRCGMEELVSGGLRAVVMGQRRGDPWMEKVSVFSPSDDGWPPFMRINPIIDWSYSHVWDFLRAFGLPYCCLYDAGFTSLGSVSTTSKNPALLRPDGSYAPAYNMTDGSLERAGRSGSQANSSAPAAKVAARAVDTSPSMRAFKSAGILPEPRTAGVVVVGNEILTGKVHDENCYFLCRELHSLGVVVKGVHVVADDVDAIARRVKDLSARCDFVFTSGGLGPTHDDVTMEGLATAFDSELLEDERFLAMLGDQGGSSGSGSSGRGDRSAAFKKMAQLPRGASVEWPDDGNPWPIVSMRNVFIFAGRPDVFRAMYKRTAGNGRFKGAKQWVSRTLWLDTEEEDVLEALSRTVDHYPFVEIGSYPHSVPDDAVDSARRKRLSITFEAFDDEPVMAARDYLKSALPDGILVDDVSE